MAVSSIITLYLAQKDVTLFVNFYAVPALIVALFAYMVASVFFSILELAIDTIFLSFCSYILAFCLTLSLMY